MKLDKDAQETDSNRTETPIFEGSSFETTAYPWINSNKQTVWFDLSPIYGTSDNVLNSVRDMNHGCNMRLDEDGYIIEENGSFVVADHRANQSPYLICMIIHYILI